MSVASAALAVAMVVIFPIAAAATGEGVDQREDPVVLTQQRLDRVLLLTKGWSYHPGDDPAWADPALDDASWAVVRPSLQTSDEIPSRPSGIVSLVSRRWSLVPVSRIQNPVSGRAGGAT